MNPPPDSDHQPMRGTRLRPRATGAWTLVHGMSALGVSVTSGFSGSGNGLVRDSVQVHTRSVHPDGYREMAGLSGLNPNGRHHVVILKRQAV